MANFFQQKMNIDVFRHIAAFTTPKGLLKLSRSCRTFKEWISYELVFKSLMNTNKCNNSIETIVGLLSKREIFMISPLRRLSVSCGDRCEFGCDNEDVWCRGNGTFACNDCFDKSGVEFHYDPAVQDFNELVSTIRPSQGSTTVNLLVTNDNIEVVSYCTYLYSPEDYENLRVIKLWYRRFLFMTEVYFENLRRQSVIAEMTRQSQRVYFRIFLFLKVSVVVTILLTSALWRS